MASSPSSDKETIIFVCTSNVCRSPMAEYLARAYVQKANKDIDVISRGLTDSYSRWGSPANPRAVQVMNEAFGIDVKPHLSKLLTSADMERASAVFVVTSEHLHWVKDALPSKVYKKNKFKIRTVGIDVPDPYFFQYEAYKDVAAMLEKQVPEAIEGYLQDEPGSQEKDPRSDARNNACYGKWPRK